MLIDRIIKCRLHSALWQFQMGGSIYLWYLHVFSMHWYFLISSYYFTVSNGCSLTALKSIEVTQCSGSFEWGSICLWYLHLFSMHWYFLISSYYLTVSNGHSLTALKSVEVTQCSGSFEWGGWKIYPKSAKFELTFSMHWYFLISSYYLTVLMGTH